MSNADWEKNMAKLLTLSKKEILKRAAYYIDRLADNSGKRAVAARAVGVSMRAVDSWCEPADPRSIPADKLMQLVIEAHFKELYVVNHQKVIDIYDEDSELIGSANHAAHASFLADVHHGYITMRPPKYGKTPEIIMSAEQLLRSRLRRIVASGKIDIRQVCRTLGCDEYVLIDMQSEMARPQYGRMPDRTGVEILESYIRLQAEEWAA
ncbi:hypothetical protein [Rhizobium giardinii]|uniref:hypothetical protein n=1 Tax=Rhizobium giardinii TaxID=56731 RepID=UPI003D6F75B7